MRQRRGQRGAAAVEFALIAVALITLLCVMVDAAWILFSLGTMGGAAREAARDYAIHNDQTQATTKALDAAASLNFTTPPTVTFSPGTCTPGTMATVTIQYTQATLTQFLLPSVPLSAKGVMRCNG